ncbi:MAG TPA: tetratricopeptide repeat protein [Stellaceae bacterium]|nr:tetratricopeptide repeat protein [Stellaceae bacterium]
MQPSQLWSRPALAGIALLLGLGLAGGARAEDYGPDRASLALRRMPTLCRTVGLGCPISGDAYAALKSAIAGDRDAQFRLAQMLHRGNGIPRDERAATAWYGKAAEQGHVAAALEINRLRHEGRDIPADEAKIAAALGPEAEKGDRGAMRALADIEIYGRGVPRDAARGVALLRRAVAAGSAAAAADLANLYLRGAPGIDKNPAEGFRWMGESGRRGNLSAMLALGSMYFRHPDASLHNPVEGYRWLMRAALLDDPSAQEMLSEVLAEGAMVGARTVIAPDPVAADMWLRLAARSPYHDNASLRLQIEGNMTSAQLEEAKKRAAEWRPRPLREVLAMAIAPPAAASAKRPWPPGLMPPAIDRLTAAAGNPQPWQRLPDFARNEEVMAAITAVAAYCDAKGRRSCADNCRRQLDYVAPPVKAGGLSAAELARYLREHPDASPVRAMRKEAATAEQAMHFWVLCANGLAAEP